MSIILVKNFSNIIFIQVQIRFSIHCLGKRSWQFAFHDAGESPVLYCWEVQVEAVAQRKGIGRFLMQLLELIARR